MDRRKPSRQAIAGAPVSQKRPRGSEVRRAAGGPEPRRGARRQRRRAGARCAPVGPAEGGPPDAPRMASPATQAAVVRHLVRCARGFRRSAAVMSTRQPSRLPVAPSLAASPLDTDASDAARVPLGSAPRRLARCAHEACAVGRCARAPRRPRRRAGARDSQAFSRPRRRRARRGPGPRRQGGRGGRGRAGEGRHVPPATPGLWRTPPRAKSLAGASYPVMVAI